MARKYFIPLLLFIGCVCRLPAQEQLKLRFGDIRPADFAPVAYAPDSSAAAVILADIGRSEFLGNNKGGFSLLFTHYRRARILNRNGYDIASVEIPLYKNGEAEELLDNLKAVTYNLENGKVVATRLDLKNAVYKDVISKKLLLKKFTFPAIRAGSIIEYEYVVKSDFIFNLQPWEFQGAYPRLWTEYKVTQPEFYSYVTLTQGYHPYHIRDQKSRRETFYWSDNRSVGTTDRATFTAGVTDFRWVMKDVPALREERYTSTLRNHIARIEFQLKSVGEPYEYRNFMASWPDVTRELMEDESFGQGLRRDNAWLREVMAEATGSAATPEDKARSIYAWVRDHFTCTNRNRLYTEQPLKNLLRSRQGNEAEINLLLTAMLIKAGLQADPLILSTRSHGYTHALYPLMERFNYVACRLVEGGRTWLLDASQPDLGFGRLSYECYNGHARVVDDSATAVSLEADSLREQSTTSVFIINNEQGRSIGSFNQTPGYFASLDIRHAVKDGGQDAFFAHYKKDFGAEIGLQNGVIRDLKAYDRPVQFSFDFDMLDDRPGIFYLNPLFGEGFRENPFTSVQRYHPVEMPYCLDETFTLQLEVPAGYEVEELPAQSVIKMNAENDGFYEYRISQSGNSISFRSRLVVNRTFYAPEEYEMLRDFFAYVVKKQNESIVFKKKK